LSRIPSSYALASCLNSPQEVDGADQLVDKPE